MIRKLLATTAFATLVATGAWAQDNTTTTEAPAANGTMAPADAGMKNNGDHLATNIIGENVYTGTGDNAQNIGDVNDLVVDSQGKIKSVIVGVGGFLGIGEKNVALDFSALKWTEGNGDRWLVTDANKDALQALPAFDRSTYDPAPAATTAMSQNANGTMSTDTGLGSPAPANNGMAPANGTATTAQDATQTAAVDKTKLTEVPADKLTADTLIGTTVYGSNDSNVGEIADIVLDKSSKVDAVLIDVGGFLGIGEKRVAVGMDKLSFMQDANGNRYLYTTLTKDQLEAQAAYNADTYAADRDTQRMTVR